MIRRSAISDVGVFDSEVLIACLRDLAVGKAKYSVGNRLCAALSLIAWFDQLHHPLKCMPSAGGNGRCYRQSPLRMKPAQ
jgi:hypothetical protein